MYHKLNAEIPIPIVKRGQIWVGSQHRNEPPIYDRIIIKNGKTRLRKLNGEVLEISEHQVFVDYNLVKQALFMAESAPRRSSTNVNSCAFLDSPFLPVPKNVVLRDIPDQIETKILNDQGKVIGSLTLGEKLREIGIDRIETNNYQQTVQYPVKRILYVIKSYEENEYSIVFHDDNNEVKTATRKLPHH